MKKYLAKLGLAGLIFLVLNVAVATCVTEHHVYRGDQQRLEACLQAQPSVLMLGDSHPAAIEQDHLGAGIHNFARGNDAYFDVLLKLNYCLERRLPVRVVILGVDPHCFSTRKLVLNNKIRSGGILAGPAALADAYGDSTFEAFRICYLYRPLPILNPSNGRLLVEVLTTPVSKPGSPEGGVAGSPRLGAWERLDSEERTRRAQHWYRGNYQEMSPELAEAFRKILKTCREHDILVLAVRFPLEPSLSRMAKASELYDQVDDLLQAEGAPVLDLSEEVSSLSLFEDQDHVNEEGSRLLATRLNSAVKRLIKL